MKGEGEWLRKMFESYQPRPFSFNGLLEIEENRMMLITVQLSNAL